MRDLEKIISKRIHTILGEKDWSPYTLSQKTEIASGYLTELLNCNPKRRWNTDMLGKVAAALSVPAWHLFIDPREVIPDDLLVLADRYGKLEGDNKRIVDAMLAAADIEEKTPPKRSVSKKRSGT